MRDNGNPAWRLLRVAAAVALVAGIIACFRVALPVNSTTVALVLLLAILGVSTWWGLVEASVASFAAVLGFNYYFLPPVGTLTIADPENWVALVAFLVTAVTASQLSARAKRRALEAEQRRREIEMLYAVGQSLLLRGSPRDMLAETVTRLAETFALDAATFYNAATGDVFTSEASLPRFDKQLLQKIAGEQKEWTGEGIVVLPIRLGGQVIGSLGLAGRLPSGETLQALAYLVAVGIERARALEEAARAEAARQSEILKSALLDALAHNLKTPLTSIKAAASGMLAQAQDEHARELLTIIDEESDRLNRTVAEVIEMARIESGKLHADRKPWAVAAIVSAALEAAAATLGDRPVQVKIPDDLPPVDVDGEFIQQVLRQIFDNAAKYSPPGSPLAITAERGEQKVLVNVGDRGAGVEERDQARIFEKFFRGRGHRYSVSGTGMGLAIAKGIVEAHGGKIWVTSQPGQGSIFTFSLPVYKGDAVQ